MNHIYNHLEHLRLFDYSVLKEIDLDFAPTGFYQELAMRNYWGDEYISLSKIFDTSYERLTSD